MDTRTIPREVTPQEIGWLAGILDGEGSIAFGKTKNKSVKRGYNFYHGIYIVNTNTELIEKSSDIIFRLCADIPSKSKMSRMDRKLYKSPLVTQRKQCFAICVRNRLWTIRVLEILIPHLTEKRKKALALIEILNIMTNSRQKEDGTKKYSYYTPELEINLMSLWSNARND